MTEDINALLVDAGCFERGCACYDPRDQVPPVPMAKEKVWVGLTDEEMLACNLDDNGWMIDRETAKRNVEAKLKEKNT